MAGEVSIYILMHIMQCVTLVGQVLEGVKQAPAHHVVECCAVIVLVGLEQAVEQGNISRAATCGKHALKGKLGQQRNRGHSSWRQPLLQQGFKQPCAAYLAAGLTARHNPQLNQL